MDMDASTILAIVTIVGNILLAIFQLRTNIATAKEKESSAAAILIERALDVAEKEVKYLQELNHELSERIKEQEAEIQRLKKELEKYEANF
jgi:predicted RNase H-like nuclease (RuvC/YqgF family)